MKKLLMIFIISGLMGLSGADLTLYKFTDDVPENYYETMDSLFSVYVDSSDSAFYNKGHIGLGFLELTYAKYDIDFLTDSVDVLVNAIAPAVEEMMFASLMSTYSIFQDGVFEAPEEFVHNLSVFFSSGQYSDLKDTWMNFSEEVDSFTITLDSLLIDFAPSFSSEMDSFGYHMDEMWNNDADYEFILQTMDMGYDSVDFIFSRAMVNRVKDFDEVISHFGEALDDGFYILDSLEIAGTGDSQSAVDTFIYAFTELDLAMDTLRTILTTQPFSPFEYDLVWIDSVQSDIDDVLILLEGKEYEIEDYPGYTIKPVSIIKNIPFNLVQIYLDFYTDSSPETYTFGDIFPNGIPQDWIDKISEDMTLNSSATKEELTDYFIQKEIEYWLTINGSVDVSNPMDPIIIPGNPIDGDAHTGLAVIEFFRLMDDINLAAEDLTALLDSGHVDSALFHFDWTRFNRKDKLANIMIELEFIAYVDTEKVFTILLKEGYESSLGFAVTDGDNFVPLYITSETAQSIINSYEVYLEVSGFVSDAIHAFTSEMDSLFDVYLDPNLVDFSNIESDLDLILALEAANPNFLELSDYGKEQFMMVGDNIGGFLAYLKEISDSLLVLGDAMYDYAWDFDIDPDSLVDGLAQLNTDVAMLSDDFNVEGSVSTIDDEIVNLSAWFDNPPDNLLQVWKNYLTGVDSSLWGFFPDRPSYLKVIPGESLPKTFSLHPAYPNPFNPMTNIAFEIPEYAKANVSIHNVLGQKVAIIHDGFINPGSYKYFWNAASFASGIYFVKVQYKSSIHIQKITLLK